MGLCEALRGLVSKHDDCRFEQSTACCSNDSNFTTPMARVYCGEARVSENQPESSSKGKFVSPPASTARRTTSTYSSVPRHSEANARYTENGYTLAEMSARMAYTNRYGNRKPQTHASSTTPSRSPKAKPVVIVKRKPLPNESKSAQGSRTPSPLRSTDEPRSDPPTYLTHEGGERSQSAARKADIPMPPALCHDDIHRRVTHWASNTAVSKPLIEEPPDMICDEAPSATMASPVCKPTKRQRKGKKNTVATSHLARGSMRSQD
ncbi:hypothetical protein LY78DRAFT_656417 [Colletotrichum sublineola]|nr:hypothetical protein LY78DRAFT_656417 [Colletotrichum sublineola]